MSDTLDLIQKLIRLATSNNSEAEARAAATKACALIIQHGVVLQLNGRTVNWNTSRRTQPQAQAPQPSPPAYEPFAEYWYRRQASDFERRRAEEQAEARHREEQARRQTPRPEFRNMEELRRWWTDRLRDRQPTEAEVDEMLVDVAVLQQRTGSGPSMYGGRRGGKSWVDW